MSTAAPDYIEPIVGWRAWLAVEHEDRLQLRSITRELVWPERTAVTAECRQPRRRLLGRPRTHAEAVPVAGCSCGIYAAREVETAIAYADCCDLDADRVLCRLLGRVSLWGLVVECSDGWRAERAYPSQLYVPDWERSSLDAHEVAERLGAYGVPVEAVAATSRRSLALRLGGSGRLPRRRLLR